jgi:hypothetical protein
MWLFRPWDFKMIRNISQILRSSILIISLEKTKTQTFSHVDSVQ